MKQNNPLLEVQLTVSLHPAPTDPCSAKCQRAPGAHLCDRAHISMYLTRNGAGRRGVPPLHPAYASLLFHLILSWAKLEEKLFFHMCKDFLVPAVSDSCAKPGVSGSPRVTRALPWGSSCIPWLVGAGNPRGGSSAPLCCWRCRGSRLQQEKEHGKCCYGTR